MTRAVCLFTGQWADLSLETLLPKVKAMGFDGVELACWGDHFEVQRALAEDDYCAKKWELLEAHGMACYAISTHLVGQAVCDRIDARHESILPPEVWGDGDPDGVRARATEEVKDTARAARRFASPSPIRCCATGRSRSGVLDSIGVFALASTANSSSAPRATPIATAALL